MLACWIANLQVANTRCRAHWAEVFSDTTIWYGRLLGNWCANSFHKLLWYMLVANSPRCHTAFDARLTSGVVLIKKMTLLCNSMCPANRYMTNGCGMHRATSTWPYTYAMHTTNREDCQDDQSMSTVSQHMHSYDTIVWQQYMWVQHGADSCSTQQHFIRL